jgi:hypothetical protein
MTRAIKIGFHGEGILLASDDALFKPFNLNLNQSRIWFVPTNISKDCTIQRTPGDGWWGKTIGRSAILEFWKEINRASSPIIDDWQMTLARNGMRQVEPVDVRTCKVMSDIFFVPKSKFASFEVMSSLVYNNRVFLEYAVPLILHGLSPLEDIEILDGSYLWGGERAAENTLKVFESVKDKHSDEYR